MKIKYYGENAENVETAKNECKYKVVVKTEKCGDVITEITTYNKSRKYARYARYVLSAEKFIDVAEYNCVMIFSDKMVTIAANSIDEVYKVIRNKCNKNIFVCDVYHNKDKMLFDLQYHLDVVKNNNNAFNIEIDIELSNGKTITNNILASDVDERTAENILCDINLNLMLRGETTETENAETVETENVENAETENKVDEKGVSEMEKNNENSNKCDISVEFTVGGITIHDGNERYLIINGVKVGTDYISKKVMELAISHDLRREYPYAQRTYIIMNLETAEIDTSLDYNLKNWCKLAELNEPLDSENLTELCGVSITDESFENGLIIENIRQTLQCNQELYDFVVDTAIENFDSLCTDLVQAHECQVSDDYEFPF